MKRILLSVLSLCITVWGYAQSSSDIDSTIAISGQSLNRGDNPMESIPTDNGINLPEFIHLDNAIKTGIHGSSVNNSNLGNTMESKSFDDSKEPIGHDSKRLEKDIPHIDFYAHSKENVYLNLLDSRSATAGFYLKYYNLRFDALLTANKYLGANNYLTANTYAPITTNQFGISGILQYDFSQNWSITAWGTYYNVIPYYSMAALPFIQTSSYGGYLHYNGDKAGIKLGAKSYYDAFIRQWRTEPIVTPSINISKKVKLEFPIGPLIQQSIEHLIINSRNNGPIAIPPQRP